MRRNIIICLLLLFYAGILCAQHSKTSSGITAIREDAIKKDLFDMASDHFRGREAGTLDELKVSMWLADRARAAGLKPAGDDGTFFQFFSMWRNRISLNSKLSIGTQNLSVWRDALLSQTAGADVDAPIVFMGKGTKEDLVKTDIKGKAVVIAVSQEGITLTPTIAARRYIGQLLRKYSGEVSNRGAAALVLVADSMIEANWKIYAAYYDRGTYDITGGAAERAGSRMPIVWLHSSSINQVQQPGQTFSAHIFVERFEYPSVNIVGKIEGSDPALKNEYVLFSGHQDHDGVRNTSNPDSIYNGADDNASVSVALLAIARAFEQQKGKRSVLFVWHGAEERGLLGSKWYAQHSTVNKDAIVAVLNGDMIGRNNPDSAALLGTQPPHRNSVDLVNMALAANKEGPNFKLDTLWDKTSHPEGWYFRSDHVPYARAGIPALFYSTLLHPDYHTPADEASHIDVAKLTRMTQWMYRTGWKVANAAARPTLEAGFKLER